MKDEASIEVRKRVGDFLASSAFDPHFEQLHQFSRPMLFAGLGLFALFLRRDSVKGAFHKLTSGDCRSSALRRRYARLAQTGRVIFTYVVVCNSALTRQPGLTAPALVIGNFNEDRDEMALLGMLEHLGDLSLGQGIGPKDQPVARLLNDLGYRFGRRRFLPLDYTGGVEVIAFDLMIVGDFLPTETLQIEAIPCLAEPGRRGLICMIPWMLIQDVMENRSGKPLAKNGGAMDEKPASGKPDHFNSIGFSVDSPRELEELAGLAAKRGKLVQAASGGSYVHFSTADGAELWVQKSAAGELIGCNPHFSGSSRFSGAGGFRATLTRLIDSDGTPLDGRVVGAMSDEGAGCPIVFDVPDFRHAVAGFSLPLETTVQIAAFAHEFHFSSNEEAFRHDQLALFNEGPGFASESFIPSGTFKPSGESIEPPVAMCILSGRVLEAEQRTNSLTRLPFYALVVKTLGGVIDMVVAPQLVKEKPAAGGIVFGTFWLSGKVMGPQPPPVIQSAIPLL